MKFIEAVAFNYVIDTLHSFAKTRHSGDLPKYAILWNTHFGLLTGRTYEFDSQVDLPVTSRSYDPTYGEVERTYAKFGEDSETGFQALRSTIYRSYMGDLKSPVGLYRNPDLLLADATAIAKQDLLTEVDVVQNRMLDVSFYESGKAIPFLISDKLAELEPISLISKN
ncbi:hypothetical protein [Schleiferilactobacillus harbinensis]|uniref:Uncharacterized protein n=1 Tax=Schleiferilactobacillus harbinensis TaxID=304207 RepID=A0A5P8M7C3_9LACO|nr:hypothetical protein [Schleiferilactobacillus harbinensis]QFR24115.1 hypothetical protein D1010_12365 [Schleiferilactobacillus harbinensis]